MQDVSTPIETWDEIFVRGTRSRVNSITADPTTWGAWWPHARVAATAAPDRFDVTLGPRWPLPHLQRLSITVDRVRPRDKGVELTVDGDVVGKAEIFHLDGPHGVVVNYLLRGRLQRRGTRARLWIAGHRGSVRAGLVQLKQRIELGRTPGAEPHPELIEIQRSQLEIFAAEHAVFEAEQALAAARSAQGGDPR